MKIVQLTASNIKRLTAVEIRPDGAIVEITGRNGQGKTSILDAIWWCLSGTRNVQTKPIRHGAERALIKLDLGEYIVTRTFKLKDDGDYTTSLTVDGADGSRPKNPQALLNEFCGEISFEPMVFLGMPPKDQFDALRRFVPGVDFQAIELANKKDYDERTAQNRRADELSAQAAAIVLPAGAIPELVDVAALERCLGDASSENATLAQRQAKRQAVMDRCEARTREIQDYREMIEKLIALQKEDVDMLENAEPLPAPVDVQALVAQLSEARTSNQVAARADQKRQLADGARIAQEASDALTKAMKDRNAAKAAAIAKAKMPVPGLGFGDGAILLNGAPFDQASDAEQLRASIAIAGAMNPTLRVLRVRDGSLIDNEGMRLLAAYAEANDLQIWIERVTNGEKVGFVIEDGHLAGAVVRSAAEEEAI